MTLFGRRVECGTIDQLLFDVRAGKSRVLVLRGEAGVGKSALLDYLTARVEGSQLATAVGIESEMELAYSGLHQLCVPMLDNLDRLPVPQRDALATVFGLGEGPPPGRFLVGLATLTLFAEVSEQQSLVCIVEDAQWLDHASAQVLGFVARRLLAERVALVAAVRTGIGDGVLAGLPELLVGGLGEDDARALLLENLIGPLDAVVCDQIVAESHGNPLALLEFPRTWGAAKLAGGFGLPESHPVAGKIEESYVQRLRRLPSDTQLLVLAAAAEPLGDEVLLHTAAKGLEIDMTAAGAAVDAGLLTVGGRVEFAHPLVRSAAYRSAGAEDRRRVHRALADATDSDNDPDRRAWHRARATSGPDEDVAADLEWSAGRAQARGGIPAAAAFLQRAVELTEDPGRRSERAIAAAETSLRAGARDAALRLAVMVEAGPHDGFQSARVALLRGHAALISSYGNEAAPLLLEAARRLERFDLDLARNAYLLAWGAAVTAGHLGEADTLLEVSRAVKALPPLSKKPHPLHLLLDGLALLPDGWSAATPILQRAAAAVNELRVDDVLMWGWLAPLAAPLVWDIDKFHVICERQIQIIRDAGALSELPVQLQEFALAKMWIGDLTGASLLIAEGDSVAAATGTRIPPFNSMRLLSLRGMEVEASAMIDATIEAAAAGGQGIAAMDAHWAAAVLYVGLARYSDALSAARQVTANAVDPMTSKFVLPELVEAAVRTGDMELARAELERLAEATQPAGTEFALGIEARSRALVTDGDEADRLYVEAVERLRRAGSRPDLARAHLLYGEFLRREGQRVDAREQLRAAYELCTEIGMEGFAERARRELLATGEKVRKRSPDTRDELTPQEEQIARLARDGLSNPEIGAQLFISARTVEWHLRKVFTKLGITSRRQLRTSLPKDGSLVGGI